MEESHQEATEKEVERILGYLKSYYQDDREFVVDSRDINISSVLLSFAHVSLMCLCFYLSNITDIILWVCHWPQLVFPDCREHFPHIFSNQSELPLLTFIHLCILTGLVCPLVAVGRYNNIDCILQDGLARMYLDNAKLPCIGERMWHLSVSSWLWNDKVNVSR